MTIFGPDIHPDFQAGISIDRIAAEGFSFLAVKASQGTSGRWADGAKAWLDRADQLGLVTYVYHYVDTSNAQSQARTIAAACHGRPVMMDFEQGSGSVTNLKMVIAAARQLGVRVPLAYVPRWYWQQIGSPSLAGLPATVSSRYLTATGYASAIYDQIPTAFWDSYGGSAPTVLQFSDRASVAGRQVDVNAFRGTKAEFHALIYGEPLDEDDDMFQDKYPLFDAGFDIWDVACGPASYDSRRIFVGVTLYAGRCTGWVDFQDDKGGTAPRKTWDLTVGTDNLSPRFICEVPPGSTKARIGWDATKATRASLTLTGGKG